VRYWIVMFRPETHAEAVQHGLIGVQFAHRKRFSELKPGDKFVAYLSRVRKLDGYGEISSEPFEEVSEVPDGWRFYVERCRVRFDQTSAGVDASELLWGLSAFAKGLNTSPANYLFCKGGFLEVTAEDFDWLSKVLDGTWVPPVGEPDAEPAE
jgi:hypothetical protein